MASGEAEGVGALYNNSGKPSLGELAQSRFLQQLDPSAISAVLGAAKQQRYPAKSIIFRQDARAEQLFMVGSGQARYFYVTWSGKKMILAWLRPGEIVGLKAMLSSRSLYLVSAETISESDLLVWDSTTVRSLAMRYPGLWENALWVASDYFTLYIATHTTLVSHTARRRLADLLITLAEGLGRSVNQGIELNITNEELANAANVTHFTASRLIREWQRQGILEKYRGRILLRSPEALSSRPKLRA